MPRIEALRPGESLETSFEEIPLPELLVGLLRANLTGLIEIPMQAGVADFLYFRNGVPVSVTLPSIEVSLSELLLKEGAIGSAESARLADAIGRGGGSESKIIEAWGLVPSGRLQAAMRARARMQLARLVGRGAQRFVFHQGRPLPPDAELAILQPLPIIFEGLSSELGRDRVEAFVRAHEGARFALSETYPDGVDPFEWGETVEAVVRGLKTPQTIEELHCPEIDPTVLGAVLMSLQLTDMVTVVSQPMPSGGHGSSALEEDLESESGVVLATEANEEQRMSSGAPGALPPRSASAVAMSQRLEEMTRRLEPFRGKTYYDLLRVRPDTKAAQLERSYQYLLGTDAEGDDVPSKMVRDFLGEAYSVLADSKTNAEYAKLVKKATTQKGIKKRQAYEAGPKLARVAHAICQSQFIEAAYLIQWATALDAERADLAAHRAFLQFCRTPGPEKPQVATTVAPVLETYLAKAPADASVKLYSVIAHVALGQAPKAQLRLAEVPESLGHPMYPLAAAAVAAVT